MGDSTILTFGYQGQNVKYLGELANLYAATVIDVRYKPWSSQPGWKREDLQAALPFKYVWVQEFGNINYEGPEGKWMIRDAEGGCKIVLPILKRNSVILLCRETYHMNCHRSIVADLLAERSGLHILNLLPEAIQKKIDGGQLTLF